MQPVRIRKEATLKIALKGKRHMLWRMDGVLHSAVQKFPREASKPWQKRDE